MGTGLLFGMIKHSGFRERRWWHNLAKIMHFVRANCTARELSLNKGAAVGTVNWRE